jgi:RNA polymerase sigma factor FliA
VNSAIEEHPMFAYAQSECVQGNERERLILENLPQVRLIARRIQERLPENVVLEDLISSGIIGLISAIDNFDPNQNVKLKTYAEYKIRGAILDSLRSLDWAPRQRRKRAKQIEAAISQSEQQLKRSPTEEEIANRLKISVDEYHEWLVEIRGLNIASLEQTTTAQGHDLLHFIADDSERLPSTVLERAELEKIVAQAIERLPEVERCILSLYYHEELTLREIASVVNLHESRVSQLKSQAILRLRSSLVARWPSHREARA